MRTIPRFILTALASCLPIAVNALTPDDSAPLGKLPDWVQPLSYHLDFRVDPSKKDYTGTSTIDIDLKQPADHIWLHGEELAVTQAEISAVDTKATPAKVTKAKYTTAAAKEGVAALHFGQVLPAGHYQVKLSFKTKFNQQLQGVYKVSFQGKPYVMTQMEAISARYGFPSFDEPRFKTPFQLTLTVPKDQVAVTNTQQVSEEKTKDGWRTVKFAPTKPLPTYLVAFAVGPWDVTKGPDIAATQWRKEITPLRGISPHGTGQKMTLALSETPAIIHMLEEYFGFGYPFDKLDILGAPDFAAGAMENPGLVTFRDYYMLLDKDSPVSLVQTSFNVNAHELAHQWFGDTVTMPWWDDLWLNEAFATWMQKKVTQKLHPEYRADLDVIEGANGAMQNDSLVSVRRIRQPIINNGDIDSAFDGITYQKGAAVLNMFERYLGAETFRKGIQAHVQQHQFGSATADDLIATLAKTSGQGDRFVKAMQSFLDQPGVPLIETRLSSKNGQTVLHVKQQRYLPYGSTGDVKQQWGIPVCVRYGEANTAIVDSKVQCELLDQAEGDLVLKGATASSWYIPNADAAGYYRFSLADSDWSRLNAQVTTLSDAEQLAYADAIDSAFQHGDIDASVVLTAVKKLAPSKTREVATALIPTLSWLNKYLAKTPAEHAQITTLARDLYLARLQALGYERRAGESQDDGLLRATLTEFLAMDIKLPEVRQALLAQSEKALKPNTKGALNLQSVNAEVLGPILGVAVQEKDRKVLDQLIKELGRNADPAQRLSLLYAIGATTQKTDAEIARNVAIDERVKVGEMRYLLNSSRLYGEGRAALWDWFVRNNEKVIKRTGSHTSGRIPGIVGGNGCSQQDADQLTAFFQPRVKELVGTERTFNQTRENALLCKALVDKQPSAAILK